MHDTPISGPITSSMTHQARDASSSRHSLRSSQTNGPPTRRRRKLRPRKNEILGKLCDLADVADPAGAEQHEAIADAERVVDLVDGEKERPSRRSVTADAGGGLPPPA